MHYNSMKLNSSFFMLSVNCWQTSGVSHEAFLQDDPKLGWGELVLCFHLTPFLQSQVGLKMQHCTEGERARDQDRVCLLDREAILCGQRPDLWVMEEEDRVKVFGGLWESVRSHRQIYSNPVEKDAALLVLSPSVVYSGAQFRVSVLPQSI